MLRVLNNRDVEVNVLHFQGKNVEVLNKTFNLVKQYAKLDPIEKDLTLVSCWTDNRKCHLYQQLLRQDIELINALPSNYDYSQQWDMRNKIRYYIDCLNTKVNTRYVMLLDGYDVVFASTKNILSKFKNLGYKIIFNTSFNNFPEEDIDYIENRDDLGFFKYFNAGCCIGYTKDVIKFYEECLNYINVYNPINSEQKILRYAFAKYSNDKNQRFIWVDKYRDIFHTMALTTCDYNAPTRTLRIDNNIIGAEKYYKKRNNQNF